jgi:hypothetical protein
MRPKTEIFTHIAKIYKLLFAQKSMIKNFNHGPVLNTEVTLPLKQLFVNEKCEMSSSCLGREEKCVS